MKRSAAIKRIQEVLEEAYGEENSPYAECILHVLENDGMLPPMCKESMTNYPFHVTDSILESTIHDFKWDEE